MRRLMYMEQFENDLAHRKIMQTKDTFIKNDHLDAEEAKERESSIDKRKFLVRRLLKHYSFSKEVMMKTMRKYVNCIYEIMSNKVSFFLFNKFIQRE